MKDIEKKEMLKLIKDAKKLLRGIKQDDLLERAEFCRCDLSVNSICFLCREIDDISAWEYRAKKFLSEKRD